MTQPILVAVIKDYTDHPFYPFKLWLKSGTMHYYLPPGKIVLIVGTQPRNTYIIRDTEKEYDIWAVKSDCLDIIGEL